MIERTLPARFGLFFLAAALALLTLVGFSQKTPHVEAAGATLSHPSVACTGGGNATVSFGWQSVPGATTMYLDLSVQDDSFKQGTFSGTPVTGTSFTWAGLQAGSLHYWRVNSQANGTWQPSATAMFVPCGDPLPLSVAATCPDNTTAVADFLWAPMGGPGGNQFIDVSQDQTFPAGGFSGAGPFSPGAMNYKWTGLKPNILYYYRINEMGTDSKWHPSVVKTFVARCGAAGSAVAAASASYRTDAYSSSDRFVIASQGINAPVNVRDVGPDGQLGDPLGKDDVVRYDFKLFPGMGGYPGSGGTTVVAGHVDYHPNFEAVFWNLRYVKAGDIVDYYRSDGGKVSYKIDWAQQVDTSTDWNSLMVGTNPESLLIITCDGVFNSATHEYSNRFAAHATKVG